MSNATGTTLPLPDILRVEQFEPKEVQMKDWDIKADYLDDPDFFFQNLVGKKLKFNGYVLLVDEDVTDEGTNQRTLVCHVVGEQRGTSGILTRYNPAI